MDPIDQLVARLRDKIRQNNARYPGKQIKWDLHQDKLRDLIKHEFSIPDKYKKTKSHQSSKYLSRDEVKYLDSILSDLAGEAIEEGINIYPVSPIRSFSRSRSISPASPAITLRERLARFRRPAMRSTRVRSSRSSSSTRTRSSTPVRMIANGNATPPRTRNFVVNNNATRRMRNMLASMRGS